MNKKIILDSKPNLLHSCDELLAAVDHKVLLLEEWRERLNRRADYLFDDDKKLAYRHHDDLLKDLQTLQADINLYKSKVESIDTDLISDNAFEELIQKRRELFSKLRIQLSLFASLVTCLNWQAPAIKSSLDTRIGIEKSLVRADWNDYKRDRSEDTFHCEAFLNESILNALNRNTKPVLNIFNSGMGAFTSVLYFLVCEKIVKSKVLASSQIYVENKMLLRGFFKNSLEMFDFNDTDLIIEKIFQNKPDVVFIEPISNTNNLRLFDVEKIIKTLSEKYCDEIYFIVDVTCSVGFENLLDNVNLPENVKVLLHGSLLKAPQLGLERVNMGFVQSFGLGEASSKILDYRTLSGTNAQDFAANSLPFTTKAHLQTRMKIIEENAVTLATSMEEIGQDKTLFTEVVYPGLSSHKDHELSKQIGFAGFFFNIKFISELNHDQYFEMFTKEVINIARRENCEIVHGASFGFNHTSIYYSVGWDEPENHYIRISTGTETPYEVEKIRKVLVEAYSSFKDVLLKTNLENQKDIS